jgi:hypothetical protein
MLTIVVKASHPPTHVRQPSHRKAVKLSPQSRGNGLGNGGFPDTITHSTDKHTWKHNDITPHTKHQYSSSSITIAIAQQHQHYSLFLIHVLTLAAPRGTAPCS